MKNIFKSTLCVLALSLGMFSCNTEDPGSDTGGGEGKEGQVVINLGFDKAPSTQASYPTSTAKPTTSWTDNIKDLHILFVSTADNRVKAARELQLPQDGTTGTHNFVLQNIPASPAGAHYNVYVVANSATGNNIERTWEPAAAVGYEISTLLMKLQEKPLGEQPALPAENPEKDSKGYEEPAEIFIGVLPNADILADQNNTLSTITLKRAVSMMRVRINQSLSGNESVQFDVDEASFRIRRVGTSVNVLSTVGFASPKREQAVLYVKGKFNDADPEGGYSTGTILDPTNKLTLWKDIRLLPGGSETESKEKFDIVLIGKAPAGYIPLSHTTGLTAPALVAWSGAVQKGVTANNILEVNLTLNSRGKWLDDPDDPGIPEPGQYGDVTIDVNLADWGSIESTDIPLKLPPGAAIRGFTDCCSLTLTSDEKDFLLDFSIHLSGAHRCNLHIRRLRICDRGRILHVAALKGVTRIGMRTEPARRGPQTGGRGRNRRKKRITGQSGNEMLKERLRKVPQGALGIYRFRQGEIHTPKINENEILAEIYANDCRDTPALFPRIMHIRLFRRRK